MELLTSHCLGRNSKELIYKTLKTKKKKKEKENTKADSKCDKIYKITLTIDSQPSKIIASVKN